MISLAEPVQLSEYFFAEEFICSFPDFEKRFMYDTSENMFLTVRKNFPYLPKDVSEEFPVLWNKLDEFFALDTEVVRNECFSLNHELMYYKACTHLDKGINLLNDFADSIANALMAHNPKVMELIPFFVVNHKEIHLFHHSMKQVLAPLLVFVQYIYERWDTYSKACLTYINYAAFLKRRSLELEYIAKKDRITFDNYFEYKAVMDSFAEETKQNHTKPHNKSANTVLSDIIEELFSEEDRNSDTFLNMLQSTLQLVKKSRRYPYHDKQYSFGYFDENGRFHYTGRMNALAFILDELELKGWSSCGDKVQLLLQHISFKGKGTTLKRNLESVVSNRADFTKASYHDEAVELFSAIIKNCE